MRERAKDKERGTLKSNKRNAGSSVEVRGPRTRGEIASKQIKESWHNRKTHKRKRRASIEGPQGRLSTTQIKKNTCHAFEVTLLYHGWDLMYEYN